jgi:cytochrome oxidase Cu insertion factor (SCO1/SenC/PrrC family)
VTSARGLAGGIVAVACALAAPLHAAPVVDDFERAGERAEAELAAHAPDIGGDFHLQDPSGRVRTLRDFGGKVVILYFGYTFCPDVCPTDLAEIARAIRNLGALGREVQPIFVTLDPARDTPRVLREYAASFPPRLVALRGTEAETRRVAAAYKVTYRKVPKERGGYDLEHAAYTFVLDRDGRFADYLPPGTPAGRTTEVLREVVQATAPGPTSSR